MKTNRKGLGLISAAAAIGMLCASVCSFAISNAVRDSVRVDAMNSASAKQIGDGDTTWDAKDDLWDSANQRFDYKVLNNLRTEIFGGATVDMAAYIKNTANGAVTDTGSTLITASALNTKAGSNYGYAVKLGGLDWIVTSLTVADVGTEKDQPVMTLYLADDLTKADNTTVVTSEWLADGKGTTNTKGRNMYASSKLRNQIKSETGDFAKLALFNKADATKNAASEAKFLVQPKNIPYQLQQTMKGRASTRAEYNNPNDALETPAAGAWNSNLASNPYLPTDTYDGTSGGGTNAAYNAWGDDYIWVPSCTETGWTNYFGAYPNKSSIWMLSDEQLAHTQDYSWLRSGVYFNYNSAFVVASAGACSSNIVTHTNGIRPALHLNLNSAALSAAMPEPVPTELEYTGASPDFSNETWYNADVLGSPALCKIQYADYKTKEPLSAPPKAVGEYEVTFTLQGDDYIWAGTPTSTNKDARAAKLTIKPKKLKVNFEKDAKGVPQLSLAEEPFEGDTVNCAIRYFDKAPDNDTRNDLGTDYSKLLGKTYYYAKAEFDNPNYEPDVPNYEPYVEGEIYFLNPATPVNIAWLNGAGAKTYTGSLLSFNLVFDKTVVDISYGSGVNYDGWDAFSATNAGKYRVNLSLKNKQDYIWGADMGKASGKTEDTYIEFEIKPRELELQVVSITPSDWSVTLGGKSDVYLDLPAVHAGTLPVVIYAQLTASSKPVDICAVSLTASMQSSVQCEFVTDNFASAATYLLGVKPYNENDPAAKNYTFKLDKPYTLTVKDPVSTSGLLWRLFEDNRPAGSMLDAAASASAAWDKEIVYNGSAYSFNVNASGLGFTVDTSYGTNGYKTVKKGTAAGLTSVTAAGDYVTSVKLSDGNVYSINWTIQKAKFDLSDVRWIDDGNISFNEKGMTVALAADSVPKGLNPVYGGVRSATKVGDSGKASVSFTVNDPDNYFAPTAGDPSTYIFNSDALDDFEWEKSWAVAPREIPVNWAIGTITLTNGSKINGEILAGGFNEYVEYDYYETNASGDKLDPSAAPLEEPAVTDNTIRFYIAVAKIKDKYSGQYVFASGVSGADLVSPVFEAGRALTAVQAAAKKTEYSYWGSPVVFQYKITQGAIADSAFDVVYYRGMIRLLAAPTDPGSYRAQVALKSAFADSYYIDGADTFDFTIVRASIAVSWNESVKPPVLNLTEDQARYVRYEYRDEAGNTVGFGALYTPGTYGVIAKITDTSRYVFDNGTGLTDWLEFTVVSGDDMKDPASTLPPFKPNPDPNGDGQGGTSKTQVTVYLSSYTGQYNGSDQVISVGNYAGLPSSAFIIVYKQNGQIVSAPNAAGDYTVEISLAPGYTDNYELTNPVLNFKVVGGGGDDDNRTDPRGEGNNPSDWTIESILPIVLSGVSIILIVVFAVTAANNASAAKEARAKTKKLAAVTYSFAPASLMMLFGLSQTNWWIVAGVLMGLALLMAIVAFMAKGKKKKAFAALEEEQARVAEEKEYARREEMREEQARRDNEMRMMFASMQQSTQQPVNYEAIQSMIASSVQALLPGLQQLQALPPASPDAGAYGMPNPEADALREQLAAQQAQMSQQQALLNRILENQQNYVMPLYEEEFEDDISWLGESDEVISLEESYGALGDEGRKAYYDIGSYIMNKPRTSQNDGRYAVLFKYRGRTIFKLGIRNDAPVLYYPAGGGKAEVRIADSSSLEAAKSVVDRIISKVDSQLN